MPDLDRHLVALPRGSQQVYLSWRLLRQDAGDEPFHVERRRRLSTRPI